ncbi:glycosyltransferase family 4 protein [Streptomyces avermitilis]|uniref:glycosyltransferase family 4 protein n=1 Tax=Streptomyces avermitilis TaxID=33903 RepID=UPI0037FC1142
MVRAAGSPRRDQHGTPWNPACPGPVGCPPTSSTSWSSPTCAAWTRSPWCAGRCARAFVSMNRFEGVPISVLEARQHGLPLVLTDIPGHRGGAATSPAVFVPVDDTAAFAQHILALLHDIRPHEPDTTTLRGEWERYAHTSSPSSPLCPKPQCYRTQAVLPAERTPSFPGTALTPERPASSVR